MRNFVQIGAFLLTNLVVMTFSAQVKKLDKLEMLFDQGHYKKVVKKSEKYLSKEFASHPSPMFFHALSEYYLGDSKHFSKSDVILEFETFLNLDSTHQFQKMYSNYIDQFHEALVDEIRILKEIGDNKKAEIRYASLQRLFDSNASFDEIKATPKQNEKEVVEDESKETNTNANSNDNKSESIRENIVAEAKKHIGTPYKYGGTTSKGFDCSGYTQYVMSKNDIQIPRMSRDQASAFKKVKPNQAKKGDLVFYGSSKNSISHVGIIISNPGEPLVMIHASTSKGVMITKIDNDPYWKPKMQFITRVIND